jgi:Sulfatase
MNLSPALPLTFDDEVSRKKQRKIIALLGLLGIYLCGNIVFRWVGYTLWYGDEFYGTRMPTAPETAYQVYMACLPVLVWGLLVYLAALRFPRVLNRGVLALLTLLCLVFVETDMQWYQMSKQHITGPDIKAFFSLDPELDLGLRDSDYWRFAGLIAAHALCIGFLCLVALRVARNRFFQGLTRIRRGPLALTLICLTAADLAAVRYFGSDVNEEDGYNQWRELARANPLRPRFLDDLVDEVADRFTDRQDELEAANGALASLPAPCPGRPRPVAPVHPFPVRFPTPPNVVFITVESLNYQAAQQTDLPFFKKFARRCLRLTHHYSTGNCTHYGILGMMYASPVSFYNGHLNDPGSPSPYLDLFAAHGYKSRLISMKLLNHHYLGDYLPNFTEPPFVGATDWSLVPKFEREVARGGPRFTFLFYTTTHYPYKHSEEYRSYTPEVPDDFDYNSWDVQNYKPLIINRYKNCLREWDAWLKAIIGAVDLKKTIVVIAGDHGEELLEDGRLGHGSSFNNAQTRTPCLVYIPGVPGRDITALTSHADLMPSLVEILGWKPPAQPGLGKSIFERGASRFAIIANQNYKKRPQRWAVLTDGGKTVLEGSEAAQLRIISLLDRSGRRASFLRDPDRWAANFQAVKMLQAGLP